MKNLILSIGVLILTSMTASAGSCQSNIEQDTLNPLSFPFEVAKYYEEYTKGFQEGKQLNNQDVIQFGKHFNFDNVENFLTFYLHSIDTLKNHFSQNPTKITSNNPNDDLSPGLPCYEQWKADVMNYLSGALLVAGEMGIFTGGNFVAVGATLVFNSSVCLIQAQNSYNHCIKGTY